MEVLLERKRWNECVKGLLIPTYQCITVQASINKKKKKKMHYIQSDDTASVPPIYKIFTVRLVYKCHNSRLKNKKHVSIYS